MQAPSEEIVIVGAGETAELAYEYFTYDSPYQVVAFAVERQYLKEPRLFDLPVIPFEDLERLYPAERYGVFVALSYTQLNRPRAKLYAQVKALGYSAVSYVSSRAFVWRNVQIGENCLIMENNVLQYHVKIGNNVILWSGNHVGHRSEILDNTFVSSHVVISGYCSVGSSCFLGVNSSIGDHVTVADDCIVGAGAVVLRDTERGKVYRGNPATAAKASSYVLFRVKDE